MLDPIIRLALVIGTIAVSVIVVRFASALIKRLETARPGTFPPDPSIDELRVEIDTMQERLDFLERAVLTQNQGDRGLPPEHS